MTTILIASVGGTPAPIISGLVSRRPDVALFVATAPDAAGPGSADEIPAILQQAQMSRLRHDILIVPPDDPEAIFLSLREKLDALKAKYPNAHFIFDYTGGTKSMTSALFQCALAMPGAGLQFMLGTRRDLNKVVDGTERATRIPVDWLIAERTEARLRAAWRSYAYAECAEGTRMLLDDLGTDEKAPAAVLQRLRDLGMAAEAFDRWDRFRHEETANCLGELATRHAALQPYAKLATRLAQEEGLRLLDLWRNAERCAARGRYDDAAARCYRLIEWSAQWHLKRVYDIDTGAMDWNHPKLTPDVIDCAGLGKKKGDKTLSGLTQTLYLAAALAPAEIFDKFLKQPFPERKNTTEKRLRDMLDLRNRSILAHGTRPLPKKDWERFQSFMTHFHKELLTPLMKQADLPTEILQLPTEPPKGI
jgi:CRISPR-associated protein (TIGR02710 family)